MPLLISLAFVRHLDAGCVSLYVFRDIIRRKPALSHQQKGTTHARSRRARRDDRLRHPSQRPLYLPQVPRRRPSDGCRGLRPRRRAPRRRLPALARSPRGQRLPRHARPRRPRLGHRRHHAQHARGHVLGQPRRWGLRAVRKALYDECRPSRSRPRQGRGDRAASPARYQHALHADFAVFARSGANRIHRRAPYSPRRGAATTTLLSGGRTTT